MRTPPQQDNNSKSVLKGARDGSIRPSSTHLTFQQTTPAHIVFYQMVEKTITELMNNKHIVLTRTSKAQSHVAAHIDHHIINSMSGQSNGCCYVDAVRNKCMCYAVRHSYFIITSMKMTHDKNCSCLRRCKTSIHICELSK